LRDIAKEVAALSSSDGGLVLIGVDDDGTVRGVPNADSATVRDDLCQRIVGICQKVDPPVRPRLSWAVANGLGVLAISVEKGSEPLYFVEQRPYIRHSTVSRPATAAEVAAAFAARAAKIPEEPQTHAELSALAELLATVLMWCDTDSDMRGLTPWVEEWMSAAAFGSSTLSLTDVDYTDRAAAIFTFDDGRQLRVELTGSPRPDLATTTPGEQPPRATIFIDVDDPELAEMDGTAIRERLTLLPDVISWRAHWSDAELGATAMAEARAAASLHLDTVPAGLDLPDETAAELKRQTVLQFEAKRLLREEARVAVPGLDLEVAVPDGDAAMSEVWRLDSDILTLELIEEEVPYGYIVPDLSCKAYPASGGPVYWPMFVEVTVTNVIGDDSRERIRRHRHLALEIDLGMAGGRVTRDELRRLVVDELALKRWIFHPLVDEQRQKLQEELEARAAANALLRQRVSERRANVLAMPLQEVASQYAPTKALATNRRQARGCSMRSSRTGALSVHSIRCISSRLSSIGRRLRAKQEEWFNDWREAVRRSIEAGERTFLRDPAYDRLLGVLFPEMAESLAKAGAKRRPIAQSDHE